MARTDQRNDYTPRLWRFETNFLPHALGSVMAHAGSTRVLCACSAEERQPPWMNEVKRGWIKAEYAMLPCSTQSRSRRNFGNTNGRNHEIQRLISRSLRGVVDLELLGPRTLNLDCDVIIADGGTRTASITGSWVALVMACSKLVAQEKLETIPIIDQVAAISLGLVEGKVVADLDYSEDSKAETDLNLVMTAKGNLIEIQGTAEKGSFSRQQLDRILDVGWSCLQPIFSLQLEALEKGGVSWSPTA